MMAGRCSGLDWNPRKATYQSGRMQSLSRLHNGLHWSLFKLHGEDDRGSLGGWTLEHLRFWRCKVKIRAFGHFPIRPVWSGKYYRKSNLPRSLMPVQSNAGSKDPRETAFPAISKNSAKVLAGVLFCQRTNSLTNRPSRSEFDDKQVKDFQTSQYPRNFGEALSDSLWALRSQWSLRSDWRQVGSTKRKSCCRYEWAIPFLKPH